MALIKVGSINSFAVTAKKVVETEKSFLDGVKTFADLSEISRDIAPNSFELITSTDQRGIGIKSIKLTSEFESFLGKIFHPTHEVYFVAWAWDLSGKPVTLYPGLGVEAKDVLIPLKVGKVREFIGSGINLFPKRKITGGIAVRINLWESDQGVRTFGEAMSDTAEEIQKSKLNNLISLIQLGTGIGGVSIAMIKEASIELAKIIGTILRCNGDDYVDFFEGYYPADGNWLQSNESYSGNSSELMITKY